MFLVVPKEESTGEAVMSVDWAKANRKKWEKLVELRPNGMNYMNLACIYHTIQSTEVGLDGKALRMVEEICAQLESSPEVSHAMRMQCIFNRGMFLRGYGRFEESSRDIHEAFRMEKNSAYVAMAHAEELLREGDWENGWKIHNQARGTVEGAAQAIGLGHQCKFWDGKEHPEHLIVINEGGAGDRINYTRYLPLLTERNIKWSFFCFDEFAPFYERLPWIGRERMILEHEKKEICPPPSHWTTTFCLAGPLGVQPNAIPPYPAPFQAPPNKFHLENPDGKPVLALAWNANELFAGGLKCRSMTEGQAMRLVTMTSDIVHWVNLQHRHRMPHPVINVPFETWEDTAAVISHMDAVVTVDSGPLWLSLAMQKPTACILTACEDWKFAHNWGKELTLYHNGPSEVFADCEHSIDQLIFDIRKGNWPR